MANLTASAPVDMTDWNLNNIKIGTITQHSSTKYAVTGAAGGLFYEFIGSGLTYDGSNLMTGGIVTAYRVLDASGHVLLSVNGFSMSASQIETAIQNNDSGGAFENGIFTNTNTITGSAFDDLLQAFTTGTETISGGDGNDRIIDFTLGNADLLNGDHLSGGNGDDTFYLGGNWQGNDVDGGDGYDTIILNGDYPVRFNISNTYFSNVEQFVLLGGPNYSFALGGLSVDGQTLTFDASNLNGSAKVQLDATGEAGNYIFIGSPGNDIFRGGDATDVFWMDKVGKDKVYGGKGDDTFIFGATLTNVDKVRGNEGTDTLKLDGNYNIAFADSTFSGVENMVLAGGHNYTLTLADGNVDEGGTLLINAISLGAANQLVLDASAVVSGSVTAVDGAGNDTITGGQLNDTFLLKGGQNIVNSGAGDDLIEYAGNNFAATEQLDGGAGSDGLVLWGDYSAGVTFAATTMINVETINLNDGFDYDLTSVDATVGSGNTLTVDASLLTADFTARFNGASELDGKFVLLGGDGNDTMIGGAKQDVLTGGGNSDTLTGGAGNDTFTYADTADSTGRHYDSITDFNGTNEFIDVVNAVTGRDADISGGTLSRATFDTDLAFKVDAGHLAAGHAVFFKATAGTLNGHTFLVIDQNGTAGYQSGGDIVIDMTGIVHQADVTTATFI